TARVQAVPALEAVPAVGVEAQGDEPPLLEPVRTEERIFADTTLMESAALAALGLVPIAPAPLISVGGRSRLAELAGDALGRQEARRRLQVDLNAVRVGVGGRGAWWWGTWQSRDIVYWGVVTADGVAA